MRILVSWINRRRKNNFLERLKEKQQKSLEVLGVSPFFVSCFDADTRGIIADGFPSFESISSILEEMKNRNGDRSLGEIAIDVGANYGTYSILFARSFKKVLSFEAHPVTFKMLEQNTLHMPNIKVSPKAISCSIGKVIINEYPYNHSGRATLENAHWVGTHKQKSYPIQSTTLENQYKGIKSRIGLIKIDVEGHELEVLQGAYKLLLKHKPAVIFEYNTGNKEVLKFLEGTGYVTFYIPAKELLRTFRTKLELLNYLRRDKAPLHTFIRLYASNTLFKFTIDTLPNCELVLTFHQDFS